MKVAGVDLSEACYAPGYHTLGRITPAEIRRSEKALGVKLPKAYKNFLRHQNGASLRLDGLMLDERPKNTQRRIYEFDSIAGLDKSDHKAVTQLTETARTEWDLPEMLFPFAGDGHWWLCLDYRERGPTGEPVITHYDTEYEDEFRVAASFDSLLKGLLRAEEQFIFAIVDRKLDASSLDQLMRGLGCEPGRHEHPNTWEWKKYQRPSSPTTSAACISGYWNGKEKSKSFTDIPAHALLLRVDVVQKDQRKCIRELAAALGDRARLLHQPVDRPAVDLTRLPAVKLKKVAPRPPQPQRQFTLDEPLTAITRNDLAEMKRLLRLGLEPQKKYTPGSCSTLHSAASRGRPAMLKLLLQHSKGRIEAALLSAALTRDTLTNAGLLIDRGAKPGPKDWENAVVQGRPAVISYLASRGFAPPHGLDDLAASLSVHEDVFPHQRRQCRAIGRLLARLSRPRGRARR